MKDLNTAQDISFLELSFPQVLNSTFSLTLTGSRAFGCATKQSDYDFIVMTDVTQPEVILFLQSAFTNRFKMSIVDITKTYGINLTDCERIIRYKSGDLSCDFQFMRRPDRKVKAQNWILKQIQMGFLYPKNDREKEARLWQAAYLATL